MSSCWCSQFLWSVVAISITVAVQGRSFHQLGIVQPLAFASMEPHHHHHHHHRRRQQQLIRQGGEGNNGSVFQRKQRVTQYISSITTEADVGITSIPEPIASDMTSLSSSSTYPLDSHQQQFVIVPSSSSSSTSADGLAINSLSIFQLAVCGGLASMLGDVIMHPVDCIKTLQQSDAGMGLNVWNAALVLFQQSGIAGFYHGLWTYAGSDALGSALKFATFEGLKRWVEPKLLPPTSTRHYLPTRFGVMLVCAAISFVASSVILVPGELLKQQLQMGYYPNAVDALLGLFHQAGNNILGLYVGYQGVLFRDVPYTMLELSLYDLLPLFYARLCALVISETNNDSDAKDNLAPNLLGSSWQQEVVAAGLAGGITGFLTTPLDTIKTKLMVDGYASFWDCYQTMVDLYGWDSLWCGAVARIGWLVPLTAIYLPTYDFLKRQMARRNRDVTSPL